MDNFWQSGLGKLLKSKRFWVVLLGVVSVIFGGDALPLTDEQILKLVGWLVGGYSSVDFALAYKGSKTE